MPRGKRPTEVRKPVSKTVQHLFILTPRSPRPETRTDFLSFSGNVWAFLRTVLMFNIGFHSD